MIFLHGRLTAYGRGSNQYTLKIITEEPQTTNITSLSPEEAKISPLTP